MPPSYRFPVKSHRFRILRRVCNYTEQSRSPLYIDSQMIDLMAFAVIQGQVLVLNGQETVFTSQLITTIILVHPALNVSNLLRRINIRTDTGKICGRLSRI